MNHAARRAVRGSRTGMVVLAMLFAIPTAAQEPPTPADTIAVVKTETTPPNAEIAVLLSEATPLPAVDTVLIGRDDQFADALASGVLQDESPLLLVPRDGPVPTRVATELARLAPTRVILLGGEAALTPRVADELAGMGYAVERRAGDSRFETAIAIARTDAGAADTAILARAFPSVGATDPTQGFADALAAGGMSAERGWPVLLTATEELTAPTRDYLVAAGIRQVEIMGGTAAISASVEAELQTMGITTERLAGDSRAQTAIAVAAKLGAPTAADAPHVVLVQGQTADAWAGGFAAAAHAALLNAPIVLATGDQLPPATTAWLQDGAVEPTFAVPADGSPVLTCVVLPGLCEEARVTLGLPPAGDITFDPPAGSAVRSGEQIVATFGQPLSDAQVLFGGDCASGSSALPSSVFPEQVVLAVAVDTPPGPCTFTITFTPEGGEAQTVEATFDHTGEATTRLVTGDADGTAVGGHTPSASRDGTVVGFISDGPVLPGVTGTHVYVERDGEVELVDVRPDGTPAETTSPDVFVSADGTHVAFTSEDDTLDADFEVGELRSAYVRDLVTGTTRHVSVDLFGSPGSFVDNPSLSGDGRIVTYTSQGDTGHQESCACYWMWWRDLETDDIGFVHTPDGRAVRSAGGTRPQISADGSVIAFQSREALLPADTNEGADVYTFEIATGELELVSVAPDGQAGGSVDSNPNASTGISADGRYVAFYYTGGDLVAGEDEERGQVYLRDRVAGTTVRLTQGGSGQFTIVGGRPQVSDDGSWVVFSSERALLHANKGGCGVYRWSATTGALDRVDLGQAGIAANNCPFAMDVTDDGEVITDHLGTLHVGDDSHRNASGGYDLYRATVPPR